VVELAPAARWAVLAGGVLTAARTAGSDLDIVVCLPEDPGLPYRRSLRWRGWPVELFVHDEASLEQYLAKDLARRRPTLHRMLATGEPAGGDSTQAAQLRHRCVAVLAQGPPPLAAQELAGLRYGLTDLLDDLEHSTDPGETTVIAATLWLRAAELALDTAGHWRGGGKWLLRELRDLDPGLADQWLAAHPDPAAVAVFAAQVLHRAGGLLFDGYHSVGERPALAAAYGSQPLAESRRRTHTRR